MNWMRVIPFILSERDLFAHVAGCPAWQREVARASERLVAVACTEAGETYAVTCSSTSAFYAWPLFLPDVAALHARLGCEGQVLVLHLSTVNPCACADAALAWKIPTAA